jgi:hypothetical protein
MKEKSEASEIFKNFKALVEKESGCIIQCLRSDRGGEYTSHDFNEFCNTQGIKRQLTAAYTPQQNGVSERKNRTLLNIVISLLSCKNVPKRFWPEALKWATYVMNRSPTVSVKNITPEEAWSGIKPSVHHFRVFGCLAYAHIPDSQRKKLDNKSIKCVHLGLSDESKAYKLYDPAQRKIIVSRDVIFDETRGWDWDNKEKQKDSSIIVNEESDGELADAAQVNENVGENVGDEDTEFVDPTNENNSTDAEDQDDVSEDTDDDQLQPRARRVLGHLRDYVLGREAEEDQELHNYAVYCNDDDPISYDDASKTNVWRKAMDLEIESIEKNNTWELTTLPEGVKAIGVK